MCYFHRSHQMCTLAIRALAEYRHSGEGLGICLNTRNLLLSYYWTKKQQWFAIEAEIQCCLLSAPSAGWQSLGAGLNASGGPFHLLATACGHVGLVFTLLFIKKKKAKCCSHFQVWVLLCEQAGYFYWCIFSVLIQKLRPVMVLLPLCIAEYYHGGWMVK